MPYQMVRLTAPVSRYPVGETGREIDRNLNPRYAEALVEFPSCERLWVPGASLERYACAHPYVSEGACIDCEAPVPPAAP